MPGRPSVSSGLVPEPGGGSETVADGASDRAASGRWEDWGIVQDEVSGDGEVEEGRSMVPLLDVFRDFGRWGLARLGPLPSAPFWGMLKPADDEGVDGRVGQRLFWTGPRKAVSTNAGQLTSGGGVFAVASRGVRWVSGAYGEAATVLYCIRGGQVDRICPQCCLFTAVLCIHNDGMMGSYEVFKVA